MSVIVTIVQAVATTGRAAEYGVTASVITLVPGVYSVSCNGDHLGHACPGAPDVLIEEGDTWSDLGDATAFAREHVDAHEARQ
jgi:hypothetical protein